MRPGTGWWSKTGHSARARPEIVFTETATEIASSAPLFRKNSMPSIFRTSP